MAIIADHILDAKGLACPMPIVRTKKKVAEMEPGQVVEIQATDKGSTADLKAWAETTGQEYLGTIEEDGALKHYLRKSSSHESTEEVEHPNIISLAELQDKLSKEPSAVVVDVREPAEYAFGHIPGSLSIPLGNIDKRLEELSKDETIYVVCRSGSRSDMAAKKLTDKGFADVLNVIPGMKDWAGELEKNN